MSTNRISTSAMHSTVMAQMMARQTALAKTQSQVASGKRVQSPSDDPIATTQILDLERSRAQLEQYGKNSDAATARLNMGEQAMADATNLLQRVRDLTLQANSGVVDAASRASIATELKARSQELQDLANRRDANGEYLFSGFSTQTQPFSRGTTGVSYAGDQGVRSLQIGTDQRVADSFSGQEAFMGIAQGNGTFVVAAGVHSGTGSIDTGQVTNAAAWVRGNYTVQFTSANTWQVVDSASAVVASGAYTSGGAIAFNGVQVSVSGAPATGDTFTVAPAATESVFTTIDNLITSLGSGVDDPGSRSQLNTNLNGSLAQLDQALDHFINLRAGIGARLSTIDNATASRQQLDDALSGSLSQLQDLDYADAVSRMNQQLVGLQAAQAAYARIAQLSLFNYL
ncbi:MAG: flagellar hook-associated protein FlgL [Pseudomonadota bacterium]